MNYFAGISQGILLATRQTSRGLLNCVKLKANNLYYTWNYCIILKCQKLSSVYISVKQIKLYYHDYIFYRALKLYAFVFQKHVQKCKNVLHVLL